MPRRKCVEAVPDRPGNSLLGSECHSTNKSISARHCLHRQRIEPHSNRTAFRYPRFKSDLDDGAWVLDCSGGRLALDSLLDQEGR
jgi:hypothetical protein